MISIGTANEKGTVIITCAFTDEDSNAVAPSSIKWTLVDSFGNIINSREQVSVSVPASSIEIILSGDDLQITTRDRNTEYADRYIVIEAIYDSDAGTDLPLKDQANFKIENLKYIGT